MSRTRTVMRRVVTLIGMLLVGGALLQQIRRPRAERTWTGRVAGIPYDFRWPTPSRLRERWWNPRAGLFTPHTFGVGWSINLYRLLHPRLPRPAATERGGDG